MERISHPFGPVYDGKSRILLLGTMASPASRAAGFYYGHPQNRFWRMMGDLFLKAAPKTREQRIAFCHMHHMALWDVVQSCEIKGADDASIRHPIPQPIGDLLRKAPIQAVFTTGQKAQELYRRLVEKETGVKAIPLPSTSPANCRFYSYQDLLETYRIILPYCLD